jgi:hypothetical protein
MFCPCCWQTSLRLSSAGHGDHDLVKLRILGTLPPMEEAYTSICSLADDLHWTYWQYKPRSASMLYSGMLSSPALLAATLSQP